MDYIEYIIGINENLVEPTELYEDKNAEILEEDEVAKEILKSKIMIKIQQKTQKMSGFF